MAQTLGGLLQVQGAYTGLKPKHLPNLIHDLFQLQVRES